MTSRQRAIRCRLFTCRLAIGYGTLPHSILRERHTVKKQIVSVSILHNAKLMAAIYFVVSIPMVLLMAIPLMMNEGVGASLLTMLLMPVLYLVFGFVFTLLAAWVYNVVAARVGGFEFTTVEVGKD